jgi:methionine--tRNA ligase beta chain
MILLSLTYLARALMSETQENNTQNTSSPNNSSSDSSLEETKETANLISFAEFHRADLRVAQIYQAEKIAKSNKLVRLQVDLGDVLGKRQIVAGIGKHYSPEQLVGRKIIVVANLEPAKLMGELSQGMLLAASASLPVLEGSTEDGLTSGGEFMELLAASPEAPLGAKVS